MISEKNMIGAMFWAMNSIMSAPPRPAPWLRSSAASCADMNGVGSSMSPRMMAIFLMISEMPCSTEQEEADQQQRLGRPDDQARRHLIDTSPLRKDSET